MTKFYVTTAIDYANGDPHLGQALEKVGTDAIARYRRLRGDDVHFVMGMDEHSQSVVQAAEANGVSPQAWVDRMADRFADLYHRLDCSYDDWIRTTEPRHKRAVEALLTQIRTHNPNDLFIDTYEGLYCSGCEEFKQDSQVADGRCLEHPSLELAAKKEENHFFRLSRYGGAMLQLIQSGEFLVEPAIRRNEIIRLLEDGLQDISISRARFPWGIPFPGDPDHTVYVWFDALINYLSATGFPDAGYERLWPAELHVIGKGITRFHCVVWPAMLASAGLPLPRQIWAHGYIQWEGAKMSKTAGTAVSLESAMERHGTDALRYFLLREVGFEADGNFTWDRFDERYVADLADGLGNLVSRTLAMLDKYRGGIVPPSPNGTSLDQAGLDVLERYRARMDALDLRGGLEAAWTLVARANQYIVEVAPWTLAKEGKDSDLDAALGTLARCRYRLALMTDPFMPAKTARLWEGLGQTGGPKRTWESGTAPPVEGSPTQRVEVLFPKETQG